MPQELPGTSFFLLLFFSSSFFFGRCNSNSKAALPEFFFLLLLFFLFDRLFSSLSQCSVSAGTDSTESRPTQSDRRTCVKKRKKSSSGVRGETRGELLLHLVRFFQEKRERGRSVGLQLLLPSLDSSLRIAPSFPHCLPPFVLHCRYPFLSFL